MIFDLHISDLRLLAPSSIKHAFYFYSMPGGSLKWRKSEEKAKLKKYVNEQWWMMVVLWVLCTWQSSYQEFSIPCKSYKSPNCHVKTSVIKTHPPTNVDLTLCVAVWVWTSLLTFVKKSSLQCYRLYNFPSSETATGWISLFFNKVADWGDCF